MMANDGSAIITDYLIIRKKLKLFLVSNDNY